MNKFIMATPIVSMLTSVFLLTAANCDYSKETLTSLVLSKQATPPEIVEKSTTYDLVNPTPAYIPPVLLTGKTELQQGDILSLRLLSVPQGVIPKAETELGMSEFITIEDGEWYAVIPIANARKPGDYTVSIKAGESTFTVNVKVLAFNFDRQNLRINTSSPAIMEATSPEAYRQFDEKVPPIYKIVDETRYWSGIFESPVVGRITTNYGEIRITNGDQSTATAHRGMDIAAPLGAPVLAPNAGRVVFAEMLLNTGNTIYIEHGGGLKSVYFHMNRLDVSVGDMVKKGTQLGTVGTTGYSTGPHLHYDMRIGDQSVSPQMLFEKDAGLYSAAKKTPDIRVFVNNKQLNFDQPPYIENDRAFVPMRAVFEALGASVKWDESTKSIEARRDNLVIRLTVGSATAGRWDESGYSNINSGVETKIINNTVFVPLRFITDSLKANATWDNVSRTAIVTSSPTQLNSSH